MKDLLKDPTMLAIAGCMVICLAVVGAVALVSGSFARDEDRRAVFRARCDAEGGSLITSMTSRGDEAYVCQPPGTSCQVVFRQEGRPYERP